MMTYCRFLVWNQICAVSMVMFWSRSDCSASIRLAHSNGTPRRSAILLELLELAFGQRAGVMKQPADKRGLAVVHVADDDDFELFGGCGTVAIGVHIVHEISHVAVAPEFLESVFAFLVLRAAGALGGFGVRSSSMISRTVLALDLIGNVQGEQPRLR